MPIEAHILRWHSLQEVDEAAVAVEDAEVVTVEDAVDLEHAEVVVAEVSYYNEILRATVVLRIFRCCILPVQSPQESKLLTGGRGSR